MVRGLGEGSGYRIAGPPNLYLAAIAGVAEEEYAGARIGGIAVRAVILQIAL